MPQLKYKHQLGNLALVLILSFLVLFIACRHDTTRRIPPKAIKGVLDLSDWDFKKDGPVELSGEYEFYWMRHLFPADFSTEPFPEMTGLINVPGYWKDNEIGGVRHPGDGYATYRLNIILNKPEQSLALRLREISNAYILFINGKEVASLGVPGKDRETTTPRQFHQVIDFEPESIRMEVVLQVTNFHHRRGGGPWEVIRLGTEKEIRGNYTRRLSLDLFLFGSIFIMALYHLGLYLFRKKDRSPLYFSIFCFLISTRLLTTGGRYLAFYLPNLDWEVFIKIEYLSFYLAVPVFALFMRSIFPQFSQRVLRVLEILGIAFACVVIFTPVRLFSYTVNPYELITIFTIVYGLYIVFVSFLRKNVEALILLIGFVILGVTTINDMLHVDQIIQTGFFAPFGLFAFILSHAFLLSYRFSRAIKTVETQRKDLRDTLTTVETQRKDLRDTLGSYKKEIMARVRTEEELRESEAKYRTILHSIQEAYYEVDLEGNLTFFNDSLGRQLGYSKKELKGMNNRQFMTEETAKRVFETFNTVYETGKPAQAFDWEMITKDGSTKFVELSVSLIRDSEGQPIGFQGVARDISERKKAEEQAKLHQQQLMHASKMVELGTLVSGVAHEVNNPNNFIMLNSPILKEAWDNAMPVLEKYYEENGDFLLGGMNFSDMRENIPTLFSGISDGAKRIKHIVDELKNYVRDNSADLNQAVDINEVLKSSASLLANMIKKSTSHFLIEYGKELPLVEGNFQRLEQVMINLIQNACQALPDAHKSIFITVQFDPMESNIVIKVRDEGMGIPPETLTHITDPFFSTKHDSGGVGLGLSISARIIEEHGGTIHFQSEIGAGTTATISLPVDQNNQSAKGDQND